jgi:hypothetical protein
MTIQSGTTTTVTSVGAMILDSTSTNELNASTTTLVKGGTGLTLTATTGTLDMNANGGAVTLDSSTTTAITAGTTMAISATNNLTIDSSSGAVQIEGVDMAHASKTSFTPTIGSATVDFTMSTNTGEYTRWGNMVTYAFTLVWTDKNSATGNIRIKGLPFAGAIDNVLGSFTSKTWLSGGLSGVTAVCLSQDGQTYLDMRFDGGLVSDTNIDAAGGFSGSITVPIA